MKYITIIPARGGSKRFPNKNIYPLGGNPLITHSIKYSLNETAIEHTYVSTDSDEIKAISENAGATVITRSDILSGDYVTTADVLQNVAEQLIRNNEEFDYVILLQATNPLRPKNLLCEAIKIMNSGNYDSLMTLNSCDKKLGRIINNRFCPWNYKFGQRSQDLEPLYYENGLLYITSKKLILKGKIIGDNMYPLIMNHIYGTVDIDTKDDMEYALYIMNTHHE